jgi:hypothetical protein
MRNNRTRHLDRRTKCSVAVLQLQFCTQRRRSTMQRCCGPGMWPRCRRGRRSGGGGEGGAAA